MEGTFVNEIDVDIIIDKLKEFSDNGNDVSSLKRIGLTPAGYKAYVNKEMEIPLSLAVRLGLNIADVVRLTA